MPVLMENEVYYAAVNGEITIFSDPRKREQLPTKTQQNNNIIHIAAKHEQNQFIKEALNNIPKTACESLICDLNSEGNTPIHIAAETGNQAIVAQLCEFYSDDKFVQEGQMLPWQVSNLEGNTPAHVALLYGYVAVARYLVEKDDYLAKVVNKSKETLLHLAIQYHVHGNYEYEITVIKGPGSNEKACTSQEDLWPIVELLLKTESSVACWVDVEGSTPLHRAASLEPRYRLPVIRAILNSCPQAAEVHDERSGQSVLHLLTTDHQVPSYKAYNEGVELLNIQELYAIRNHKDHKGDTPLHLAARNKDTDMVQVLLGSSPNLNIKNKTGISAGSLVQQLRLGTLDQQMGNTRALTERRRKLTEEECNAAKEGNFVFLNEKLESEGMHFLTSQTAMGGNILHILMRFAGGCYNRDDIRETENFVEKAVRKFPLLLTQQDFNGDAPIHILAANIGWAMDLMSLYYRHCDMPCEADDDDVATGTLNCKPWRLRNDKGDTPLHAAARAGCDDAIESLAYFDAELAGYVNNRNETPLHLRCYRQVIVVRGYDVNKAGREVIGSLTKGNGKQPYMQDADGLTPILIAVRNQSITMINILQSDFPECSKIADLKGRTFWHMFVYRPADVEDSRFAHYIFQSQSHDSLTKSLMRIKDNDGNTPLHLAIENRYFEFAELYLSNVKIDDEYTKIEQLDECLEEENNKGVSCYDLIGADEHLPQKFEKFLWKNGKLLHGHRSLYGVPTTKINNYANTIGVIAALLTTITFTAGFTVPGGLDSSKGTPLLLRNAAFMVFIVSDVVAMCLSVMVLFCLLWIMTTGHKSESILLLDVSVFLLEASFYATLMTFMTGLYVTTIHVVPGIAIFTCVVCSFLILIMHKSFVMVTVAPFCRLLIILSLALKEFVSDKFLALWTPLMRYRRKKRIWFKAWLRDRYTDCDPE